MVERGRGIFAKTSSFDHIIRGNVFAIQDQRSHGIYAGAAELAVERGNLLLPLEQTTPPRPVPDVPSIYKWQKDNIPVVRELPIR